MSGGWNWNGDGSFVRPMFLGSEVSPHPLALSPSSAGRQQQLATSQGRQPASTEERLVMDLIALMETGQTPWRRPWRQEAGCHVNLISGKPYRGSNPLLLTLGMHLRGSNLPYWCGWGEARRLGLAPRRGSRGVMILRPLASGIALPFASAGVMAPVLDGPDVGALAGPDTGAVPGAEAGSATGGSPVIPLARSRPGVGFRPVVVFNAADLVGDGEASRALVERIARCRAWAARAHRSEPDRLSSAESVLTAWPVPVVEGCPMACYHPVADCIELPEAGRFETAAARLATWAHEAIHSSGHPRRLNRDLSGGFGSPAYAQEELVAELGAVLLGERLEIGSDTANHAAYLSHWCELLRQDPRLLLQLLVEARRAADLIAPEQAGAAADREAADGAGPPDSCSAAPSAPQAEEGGLSSPRRPEC